MNKNFPQNRLTRNSSFSNNAELQSPAFLRMNYFDGIFQELWSQIMEQILYRTYVLQNGTFSAKLQLASCRTFLSLNFDFQFYMLLLWSSYYGIFLNWIYGSYHTQVFYKSLFSIYWRNSQGNTYTKKYGIIRPICLQTSDMKSTYKAVHLYFFCMYSLCTCTLRLLSSGMKVRVRKLMNLIKFGLQNSQIAASILYNFIYLNLGKKPPNKKLY